MKSATLFKYYTLRRPNGQYSLLINVLVWSTHPQTTWRGCHSLSVPMSWLPGVLFSHLHRKSQWCDPPCSSESTAVKVVHTWDTLVIYQWLLVDFHLEINAAHLCIQLYNSPRLSLESELPMIFLCKERIHIPAFLYFHSCMPVTKLPLDSCGLPKKEKKMHQDPQGYFTATKFFIVKFLRCRAPSLTQTHLRLYDTDQTHLYPSHLTVSMGKHHPQRCWRGLVGVDLDPAPRFLGQHW